MDYERICKQEGYRLEDLKQEDRAKMEEVYFIVDELLEMGADIVEDYANACYGNGLLGTMMSQEMHGLYDVFMDNLKLKAQELQIYFAERDIE